MSIVKMKRVNLLGLSCEREAILTQLQHSGCVQIETPEAQEDSPFVRLRADELSAWQTRRGVVKAALDVVCKRDGKRSLFFARPEIDMESFQNAEDFEKACEAAEEINRLTKTIAELNAEEGRLQTRLTMLEPWKPLDIPLDIPQRPVLSVIFGTIPAQASLSDFRHGLEEEVGLCETVSASADANLQYLCLLYHPSVSEALEAVCKPFGFSRVSFKDVQGTAGESVKTVKTRLAEIESEKEALDKDITGFTSRRGTLELCLDVISTHIDRGEAAERLLCTDAVFYLDGWVDEPSVGKFTEKLSRFDCAYEFSDPKDEDEPPVLLKNPAIIRPFHMVSKMYSLPKYRNVDPNPLIFIFYALFFGMMFADIAYGILMVVVSVLVTKKVKPKGPMVRYLFPLMGICGVACIFWGFIFGGFFSDLIERVAITYFGQQEGFSIAIPYLYKIVDPINNPIVVLIIGVALGVVHLITGMCVKFYLLCRDESLWVALMDVGSWWLLFAGFAVTALGGTSWVMIAGFAAIVLTQGREKKSIFSKLLSGIVKLYDLSGYLTDILSYSRLMALGLTGGVLGMVFNKIGGMLGGVPVIGVVLFLIVFLIGHALNMGLNIIGTYIHAARLQYIEFFNKFYDSGGKEFAPLDIQTKYIDIKE